MLKLSLGKGQNLYIFSDPHYNHKNICRGVSSWGRDDLTRDFETLSHMNDIIVNNINSRVGPDDILLCLGDWSFGGFDSIREFRDRIICENIYLILGNHDHHIESNRDNIQDEFISVSHYEYIEIKEYDGVKTQMVACHYPIASWNNMNRGVIHIHGHVHLPPLDKMGEGKHLDVGVDGNNLEIYSLAEVKNLMKDKPVGKLVLPSDHHEKEVR